jgi:predicted SAM-dependent methyltransferase
VPRFYESVETLPGEPPFAGELMERLGLRGINCGCARRLEQGWLNTDQVGLREREGREAELGRIALIDGDFHYLRWDAIEPYPIADASFDWAFSEHFIEHLKPDEGIGWLREACRVLRPGGLIRVTTPNLAIFMNAYVNRDDPFYAHNREMLAKTRMFAERGVPDRRGWMVNNIFYGWKHRWIYDFGELEHALVTAGFDPATVAERRFGESEVSEVGALDDPGRAPETIYVEARRPT